MIIELFSRTFQLIKDNLVLVQPLLLFLMIVGLVLSNAGGFNIIIVLPIVGLYCAFAAGWFHMFHKSIEYSDNKSLTREERAERSLSLFKEFFPGVGKYFFKILLGLIIYIILLFIAIELFGELIGTRFIGQLQSISPEQLMQTILSQDKDILNKISEADKLRIMLWNGLSIAVTAFISYLTMFWVQSVISEDRNPFKAYFESLKTVLKRPFTTLIIFIANWVSIVLISHISALFAANFFIQLIIFMLMTLSVVYFTMMMFLYFEQYRKNNRISGADSFR